MSELSRPRLPMYESRAVAMTLRLLRITEDVCHAVADEHRSVRGDDDTERYSFSAFHAIVPTFPSRLCTALFTEDGPATARHLQVLLLRPGRSVVLRRFRQLAEELRGGATTMDLPNVFGMHFPCGAVQGGLVLHNATLPAAPRFMATIPAGRLGTLRLQPLQSLLLAVRASGWSPATNHLATGSARVAAFSAARIDPTISELLGRGASAMVFNILVHAAESRAAGEHVTRIDERDGEIWLRVDQRTLARATDRDVRSVKDAIKTLTARGLLKAQRGGAGNSYVVAPNWRALIRTEANMNSGTPQ